MVYRGTERWSTEAPNDGLQRHRRFQEASLIHECQIPADLLRNFINIVLIESGPIWSLPECVWMFSQCDLDHLQSFLVLLFSRQQETEQCQGIWMVVLQLNKNVQGFLSCMRLLRLGQSCQVRYWVLCQLRLNTEDHGLVSANAQHHSEACFYL